MWEKITDSLLVETVRGLRRRKTAPTPALRDLRYHGWSQLAGYALLRCGIRAAELGDVHELLHVTASMRAANTAPCEMPHQCHLDGQAAFKRPQG